MTHGRTDRLAKGANRQSSSMAGGIDSYRFILSCFFLQLVVPCQPSRGCQTEEGAVEWVTREPLLPRESGDAGSQAQLGVAGTPKSAEIGTFFTGPNISVFIY